jgi:hypothetical protein
MRAIGQPLFHAQKVEQLLFVVDDIEQSQVVLGQARERGHVGEDEAHELTGRLPFASIRRSTSSGLRLRVHRLMNPWSVRPSAWSA